MNTLIIHGKMTSMNDYINANRNHKYEGSRIKKEETERAAWECITQKIPKYTVPIELCITIQLANKRSDEDSALLGVKFILDGMVQAKVIPNDTARWVHIEHIGFTYGTDTRTIVQISPLQSI